MNELIFTYYYYALALTFKIIHIICTVTNLQTLTDLLHMYVQLPSIDTTTI